MTPLSFLPVAQALAAMSRDPSTQVGAVLLDADFNILGTGYNGFPRGVHDLPARYNDRALKLGLIAHAEANAIAQAARVGSKLLSSTLLVTALHPCNDCAKLIVQAGIKHVYAPEGDNERWADSTRIAALILDEGGVTITRYDAHGHAHPA